MIKTIPTESARNKLSDIIDDVQLGTEIIIERYRKPAAVIISYAHWQTLKRLQEAALLAEAQRNLANAEAQPHTVITHAELRRQLRAKAAHTQPIQPQ